MSSTPTLAAEKLLEILLSTGEAATLEEAARGLLAALSRELDVAAAALWLGEESEGHPRLVLRWGAPELPTPDPRRLPARRSPRVLRLGDERELAYPFPPDGVLWIRARDRAQAQELAGDDGFGRVLGRVVAGLRRVAAIAAIVRRADDHAAAESQMRESASRLAALVGSLEGAILVESEERRVVLANQAFCRLFQVPAPPGSMIGADSAMAAEGSKGLFRDPDRFVESVRRALAERKPVAAEPFELADGRWLERDYLPIFHDGRHAGHLWHYRDVTARVLGESETQRLRRFYEQVLDAMPVQLAVFDSQARYEHVTPSAIANPETRAWIVGKTDLEYGERRGLPREVAEQRRRTILEVAEGGGPRTFEESFHDREGRPRHFVRFIYPVADAQGRVTHVLGYGLDVTDRKLAEVELLAAKAAAERSTRAKEVFLANMSHEMRTPLNAVVGMSHLLRGTSLDEAQARYVQAIRFSADTLLALINDILDFSKIEAGRIEFLSTPFRLRPLLASLLEALRFDADRKGLSLRLDVAPDVPEVLRGDPDRLKQVVLNLLSNAVKFTERGFVALGVFRHGDARRPTIGLRVADTGIGIPEAQRAAIFEAFTQATPDTQRRFGGTGLGLAIVRQLVERQGGRIDLESVEGRGSTFTVHLPFEVASESDVAPAGGSGPSIRLAGLRLLVVEDNPINQTVAATLLRKAGAEVDLAGDGIEALDALRRQSYDAVLMDIQMPRMDGFEATARIRRDLGLDSAALPILALTASALIEERDRAHEVGMDDFVLKPFDPDDLFLRVARQVARRRGGDLALVAAVVDPPALLAPNAGIDLAVLERNCFGEPDFAVQLIDAFVEEASSGADDLDAAGRSGDGDRVRQLAHRLKSAAGTLGSLRLQRRLGELEALVVAGGDGESLRLAAAEVAAACGDAIDAYRHLRTRYALRAERGPVPGAK